jgi:hypothetical protein
MLVQFCVWPEASLATELLLLLLPAVLFIHHHVLCRALQHGQSLSSHSAPLLVRCCVLLEVSLATDLLLLPAVLYTLPYAVRGIAACGAHIFTRCATAGAVLCMA